MTELIRVTRGVWCPPERAGDLIGTCTALLSAAPDSAVVGGLAAASVLGFWLPERTIRPELILRRESRAPHHQPRTKRSELRGRRRTLAADEWTLHDGLPVTTIPRTWIDLAEHLTLPDLVAAGDWALRAGATLDELDQAVRRAHHRRGVVPARRALPLLNPASRSRPETHLRVALVTGGLPTPAVNEAIYSADGEWLSEPDLHYEAARLALEYNGAEHAKPRRMRRDITRELDVLHRGRWLTVTFGPVEVFGRPEQALYIVRELLRERAPQLLRPPPRVPSPR